MREGSCKLQLVEPRRSAIQGVSDGVLRRHSVWLLRGTPRSREIETGNRAVGDRERQVACERRYKCRGAVTARGQIDAALDVAVDQVDWRNAQRFGDRRTINP